MIIKRLYSSQEVVEGLHLVWDVFIRENANSCTQQGIEEFARFIKMENFMPLVESGEMIVFGAVETGSWRCRSRAEGWTYFPSVCPPGFAEKRDCEGSCW